MKIRSEWAVMAGILCLVTGVQAQYYYAAPVGAGPYFRADLGPSFFQDGRVNYGGMIGDPVRYDVGLAGDLALGYAFNPNFSADFELGYNGAEIDSTSGFISHHSHLYNVPFLVNGTVSFPIPRSNVTPYFGAGVGFAATVFDTDYFGPSATPGDFVSGSESDVVPAGQVFAGVRFRLAPNASLGVGYKFFVTGDPTFTYPPDDFDVGFRGTRAHSILLTAEVRF
jgi:opacity protein-like surface antigen